MEATRATRSRSGSTRSRSGSGSEFNPYLNGGRGGNSSNVIVPTAGPLFLPAAPHPVAVIPSAIDLSTPTVSKSTDVPATTALAESKIADSFGAQADTTSTACGEFVYAYPVLVPSVDPFPAEIDFNTTAETTVAPSAPPMQQIDHNPYNEHPVKAKSALKEDGSTQTVVKEGCSSKNAEPSAPPWPTEDLILSKKSTVSNSVDKLECRRDDALQLLLGTLNAIPTDQDKGKAKCEAAEFLLTYFAYFVHKSQRDGHSTSYKNISDAIRENSFLKEQNIENSLLNAYKIASNNPNSIIDDFFESCKHLVCCKAFWNLWNISADGYPKANQNVQLQEFLDANVSVLEYYAARTIWMNENSCLQPIYQVSAKENPRCLLSFKLGYNIYTPPERGPRGCDGDGSECEHMQYASNEEALPYQVVINKTRIQRIKQARKISEAPYKIREI